MLSKVEICNVAITRVGGNRIDDLELSNDQEEAIYCRALYDVALEATLEAYDWSFATGRIKLALLGTGIYQGWTYAYKYPNKCVRARSIWNPAIGMAQLQSDPQRFAEADKIPFEVASNTNLDDRVILTEQETAVLIFTAKISNPNLFSASFVDALGWRLASDLAVPINGDGNQQIDLLKAFMRSVSLAQTSSANEGHQLPDVGNNYTRARK